MKTVVENFLKKEKSFLEEKENIRKELLSQFLKEFLNKNGFNLKEITIKEFKFEEESAWNEITDDGIYTQKIEIKGVIYDEEGECDISIQHTYFHSSYYNGSGETSEDTTINCDDSKYEEFIKEEFPEIINLIESAYYLKT